MVKTTTNPAMNDRLVTEFLQAMAADRGLARNSLDAYRRDLAASHDLLARRGRRFETCSADDLRDLLGQWHATGLAARAVGRRGMREAIGVREHGCGVKNVNAKRGAPGGGSVRNQHNDGRT